MQRRYIELISTHPGKEGIYRDREIDGDPFAILATHHAPRGSSKAKDIATALGRVAAELAEVFPEATFGTDQWQAKVWQADWYDATH